jgi:hypothetical protein
MNRGLPMSVGDTVVNSFEKAAECIQSRLANG